MADHKKDLIETLRSAGISRAAIEAAWPSWWSNEAAESPSGRAELRFALARRLGLEAKPLLGERVEFIWNDEARFKHLTGQGQAEQALLTSYGMALGRLLFRATADRALIDLGTADQLRAAILATHDYVDLHSLLSTCWAVGIPVVHLRVFPLDAKSMHAMVVSGQGRFAILLGRDANYPAPIAFTLAHELGHILLKHLDGASALVDLEDPATAAESDDEERQADAFALTLLTGSPEPDIRTNIENFSAAALAKAVLEAGPQYRVEPGTLALCLAYRRNAWPVANAALRSIYADAKPVWREVNGIAEQELDWESLGEEGADYLRHVMREA